MSKDEKRIQEIKEQLAKLHPKVDALERELRILIYKISRK